MKTVIKGLDAGATAHFLDVPRIRPDGSKLLAVVRGGIFDGDHFLIELADGTRTIIGTERAEDGDA
jgi:hypothetical protein